MEKHALRETPRVAVYLTIRTKPGKRDELQALWEQHLKGRIVQNSELPGYIFALDHSDENVIRIAELYQTNEALNENAQAKWFSDYMQQANPLLDGEPEFHTATPVWVK